MLTLLGGVLRLASRVACLVVLASFVLFAVEQAGSASSSAQNAVLGTNNGAAAPASGSHKKTAKSALHRAIDEAAERLTSPFSGVTAGDTSQWVIRGVGTLLALVVYGIGVGYLTRLLRLRV